MKKKFNSKTKWCARCKKWRWLKSFRIRKIDKHCASGREAYCRNCANQYSRGYYTTDKRKNFILKHRYGVDKLWYDTKYKTQNGRCLICNGKGNYKGKEFLVVDHSHKTGKARGLLCHRCNIFIGYLEANKDIFPKIIKYLNGQNV